MKMNTNKDMMELELCELENISAGDSVEACEVYANYLNTLFEKYHCRGIREVKKVCTPRKGLVSPSCITRSCMPMTSPESDSDAV